MTETESGGKVAVKTESGIESLTNVADVAEVSPNRLMIADAEGGRDMIDGTIFGAWGRWKTWHEKESGAIDTFVSEDPMTMPDDVLRFGVDGYTRDQTGRLKRLKLAEL
ncbi:hypothetical protein HRTV-25_gp54 [Halorubrum tailed virus 25]|uniref:Uncharacterized protein n=1 Tax=Halorubrum tailed virus 25 TaxID=2878006 RepID=A0AAE8XXR6_9CAUD|nr:hypothetical protein M1M37_gp054 [Halorubrum tailed virus 25]UBF22635.1 hypothetical protein HRTV-25_gp54 [Halorubrum tailed virus 25]